MAKPRGKPFNRETAAALGRAGGLAAKTRNRFTSENAKESGHKGGSKTAEKPGHMATIGRIGGLASSVDRDHMSEIGKRGAATNAKKREAQ